MASSHRAGPGTGRYRSSSNGAGREHDDPHARTASRHRPARTGTARSPAGTDRRPRPARRSTEHPARRPRSRGRRSASELARWRHCSPDADRSRTASGRPGVVVVVAASSARTIALVTTSAAGDGDRVETDRVGGTGGRRGERRRRCRRRTWCAPGSAPGPSRSARRRPACCTEPWSGAASVATTTSVVCRRCPAASSPPPKVMPGPRGAVAASRCPQRRRDLGSPAVSRNPAACRCRAPQQLSGARVDR